jgi:hypothetical protein
MVTGALRSRACALGAVPAADNVIGDDARARGRIDAAVEIMALPSGAILLSSLQRSCHAQGMDGRL